MARALEDVGAETRRLRVRRAIPRSRADIDVQLPPSPLAFLVARFLPSFPLFPPSLFFSPSALFLDSIAAIPYRTLSVLPLLLPSLLRPS